MKEIYIPIDEANTDQIKFSIPLPSYVDRSRIGINMPRLEKLCKAGGINILAVIGRTDGGTSSDRPEIVGITPKGEALAGKTVVEKIEPLGRAGVSHFGLEPGLPTYMLTAAMVDININEAVDRAIKESKGEKSIREVDTWTKYMDEALKRGIKQVGLHNLLAHGHARFFSSFLWSGVAAGIAGILGAFEGNNFSVLLPVYFLFYNQLDNLGEFIHGRSHGLEDYRWSIFHGIQLDRAALFSIRAGRGSLIKALPEPKE